jgi:hypothetical protein
MRQQLLEEVRAVILQTSSNLGCWLLTPEEVLEQLLLCLQREEGNVVVLEHPGVEGMPGFTLLQHLPGIVKVADPDGVVYSVLTRREVHSDHAYVLRVVWHDRGSSWVGGMARPRENIYSSAVDCALSWLRDRRVAKVELWDAPMGPSSCACQIWSRAWDQEGEGQED